MLNHGIIATAGDGVTDISSQVTQIGSVNENVLGLYEITYSITTADGSASIKRKITVIP